MEYSKMERCLFVMRKALSVSSDRFKEITCYKMGRSLPKL